MKVIKIMKVWLFQYVLMHSWCMFSKHINVFMENCTTTFLSTALTYCNLLWDINKFIPLSPHHTIQKSTPYYSDNFTLTEPFCIEMTHISKQQGAG